MLVTACSIANLPARQLKGLLDLDPDSLPEPVAAALADFLERIGGLENAILAAEMLERLEEPLLPS